MTKPGKPKSGVLSGTPIEKHGGFYVKREDLCALEPWPSFSKIRGILAHISAQRANTIGVLDTFHSQGGWAVAAACEYLGKKCINFWPRYKAMKKGKLRPNQKRSKKLGAKLVAFKAGRSAILYHKARRYMKDLEKETGRATYMMPNALKLPESMSETSYEVSLIPNVERFANVVIPISSGTIAAGVLQGLIRRQHFPRVYIHLGYSRSTKAVRAYLAEHAPGFPTDKIKIIDEGYAYKDMARDLDKPPFPCNVYYDLKTWQWLKKRQPKGKTLFWNIGG